MFRRGRKERPRSVDVSSMFVESVDSTQATTATQLWVPKPLSEDQEVKVSSCRAYLTLEYYIVTSSRDGGHVAQLQGHRTLKSE